MSENQITIAAAIEAVTRQFERAQLYFGHGTQTARDEAAWLVLHVAGKPLDGSFTDWGHVLSAEDGAQIKHLAERRASQGVPLAYLLGSAWFAGLEFEVNEDVLVPRSPIAELILDGYRPWVDPERPLNILDLCTGSGCIAIASAAHLPEVSVIAADISEQALQVAQANVTKHGLADRVQLVKSDLFQNVPSLAFDLIVTNPPYVSQDSMQRLPDEYRAEPALGLESGQDGLDAAPSIMLDAPRFLGEYGVLICEVGESEQALVAALPELPFLWLEFSAGGHGAVSYTHLTLPTKIV